MDEKLIERFEELEMLFLRDMEEEDNEEYMEFYARDSQQAVLSYFGFDSIYDLKEMRK